MWNIHGFSLNKATDADFLEAICNIDVLSLVETWCGGDNPQIDVPEFSCITSSTRNKHKKARRFSGGISIYVRNNLKTGVSKLPFSNPDIVWVKLLKSFFNFKKDVFLGIIYFSPEGSTGNNEDLNVLYSKLLSDIEIYSSQGDIVIQGDFNAYTNLNPDYVTYDESEHPNSDDQFYIYDSPSPRNNMDNKTSNKSGKLLLNLCKETSLSILNGRTVGDLNGKYTCTTYNGSSVVDYTLVNNELLQGICSFKVGDLTDLSDHCLLNCCLLTCFYNVPNNHRNNLDTLPGKFLWNTEAIENYKANLLSDPIKCKLQKFLTHNYSDSDLAVDNINSILHETASMSAKFVKGKSPSKKNKKKKKEWFSDSCRDLRITVKSYLSLVNKFPNNETYRIKYYSFLSKYRRKCKIEEKKFKKQICDDIYSNMNKDPKTFWNMINRMQNSSSGNNDDILNMDEFSNFFEKINNHSNQIPNNNFHNSIKDKLETHINNYKNPNNPNKSEFDEPINKEEIMKAIKTLKNGKSTSSDLISNEMLKYGIHQLIEPLLKLFNFIFEKGCFPKAWNESYISLIHKKGDKTNPANYRGISLTSNLGKLFNKIILARVIKFINNNNLISENQIGFKEKSRTTDHIFTIKSIVDTYKTKKMKVFAAFIDLRKAFDTVWREGLFYKLCKNKFPTQIFNIIHSMYKDPYCRIKFKQGLGRKFISRCGVKQGDVLSPILFNLYINDLVANLNESNNDPVILGDLTINSLLYADDIILLSSTANGLQKSLEILDKFCSSWKLDVNEQKSKVMVFNSNGKTHINSFKINNSPIETVKTYCYLGITFKYNGNINVSTKLLMEKGRKAWFKIKKTIGLDNACCLMEKLFDSLVSPITLYGCELWGAFCHLKDTDPFEQLHLKFIKEILGIHSKATNVACLTELNRHPLVEKVTLLAIKFWDHISNSTNTLVNKVYNNIPDNNKWITTIKMWVKKLGFGYLINSTENIKSALSSIKQRLHDHTLQTQNSSIAESKKLSFYKTIYRQNQRPFYVDNCRFRSDRTTICKFRISAHTLAIERGRYQNIPQNNRICPKCDTGAIEDEMHFFVYCPAYTTFRKELIIKLKCCFKNLDSLTDYKIPLILNSSSLIVNKALIEYINNCQGKN